MANGRYSYNIKDATATEQHSTWISPLKNIIAANVKDINLLQIITIGCERRKIASFYYTSVVFVSQNFWQYEIDFNFV